LLLTIGAPFLPPLLGTFSPPSTLASLLFLHRPFPRSLAFQSFPSPGSCFFQVTSVLHPRVHKSWNKLTECRSCVLTTLRVCYVFLPPPFPRLLCSFPLLLSEKYPILHLENAYSVAPCVPFALLLRFGPHLLCFYSAATFFLAWTHLCGIPAFWSSFLVWRFNSFSFLFDAAQFFAMFSFLPHFSTFLPIPGAESDVAFYVVPG